ncbi:Putative extracellular membrane protein, CFEM [Septoria linicola]|uniref:Extracellular membrane protein, CFEM n=1 Tax=Septoria linicola TaxID=215465 RepID=A0A9Q9AUH7_9PEZI|nr:Putative extracellular membrane protein, CFEM [Septoria linicola]
MRFSWSAAALSLIVQVACAENAHNLTSENVLALLQTMPECGRTCLLTTISASPCKPGNLTCTCENSAITDTTTECVLQSCSVKNQLTTKNITETLCQRPIRDRRGPGLRSIIAGLILATTALALRLASKINSPCGGNDGWSTTLWWDDAVIVFGFALIIPIDYASFLLSRAGIGTDVWTLPFANITRIQKIYYWCEEFYLAALPTVKISLLLTYLRIFPSQRFRYACYFVIGLNICYAIAFVLVSVFQCLPVHCAWNNWSGEHDCKCSNINAQGWTSAAFNVLLDFITLGLPLPQLWAMKLNKRKKFWVMLMFGMGFFVTIVSILRLQVLIEFGDSRNLTWHYVAVGYWSTTELHASVITASMPSIRHLLRRYMPYVMGQSTGGTGASGGQGVSTGRSHRTTIKSTKDITIRTMDSDEENIISLDFYNSTNRTAPLDACSSTNRNPTLDSFEGMNHSPALDSHDHTSRTTPGHEYRMSGNKRTLPLPSDDAYTHSTTETIVTAGDGAESARRKKRRGWF